VIISCIILETLFLQPFELSIDNDKSE